MKCLYYAVFLLQILKVQIVANFGEAVKQESLHVVLCILMISSFNHNASGWVQLQEIWLHWFMVYFNSSILTPYFAAISQDQTIKSALSIIKSGGSKLTTFGQSRPRTVRFGEISHSSYSGIYSADSLRRSLAATI